VDGSNQWQTAFLLDDLLCQLQVIIFITFCKLITDLVSSQGYFILIFTAYFKSFLVELISGMVRRNDISMWILATSIKEYSNAVFNGIKT